MFTELNERSRQIFKYIVDSYLETGSPVGSRTLSRHPSITLSPATIRNTMADLEDTGLLYAPHTSAGRMPTELGLRLYIDGLMQVGALGGAERKEIEAAVSGNRPMDELLEQATTLLSGLSSCASIVIAPKTEQPIEQIQFVKLKPRQILAILVLKNGLVENRIMDLEEDMPSTALTAAANYLNDRLSGRTIAEAEGAIIEEIASHKSQLDQITADLVRKGLEIRTPQKNGGRLIVRGQSKLLEDVKAIADLERARRLLQHLEEQEDMLSILGSIDHANGVQIFIGAENTIFDQSGWSMIISPYKDSGEKIIGAIGVVGPTRLDYDRIIPMVDYTSNLIERIATRSIKI